MGILGKSGAGPGWCLLFLLCATASGCNDGRGIFGLPDGIAPTVTNVAPADEAENVALNINSVSAAFSLPVETIATGVTFTLTCAAPCAGPTGTIALNASAMQVSFTLTPGTELEPLTLYTATLRGFRSQATRVSMAADFTWSFTTGLTADTTAPLVSSTTPQADDTGVAFNTLIAVSFSEPMDPLSISTASIGLACPLGLPIAGTVTYTMLGNVATFAPTGDLPGDSDCTVTIGTGVRDAAGNGMAEAFSWNFTTGSTPDLTAPLVETTNPRRDAIGVNPNTTPMAVFNEPMDPLSFLDNQFTLDCPVGTPVTGVTLYDVGGSTAIFGSDEPFPAGTVCRARIDASVTDLAGNPMTAAHTWNFTTGTLPDTVPPIVSSTSPLSGDVGVAINMQLAAGFSEFMDPSSITTATFELACPAGTAVVGTVIYVDGGVATFTPSAALPGGTNCTASFATGVRDVAGNPLAAPFEWTFTTGAAPDTTRPHVISTTPLADETGIAVNRLVTASFSEAVDPQTISASSFLLECPGGTAVAASVDYTLGGSIASLEPDADLPPGTTCTATVTTAVEDEAHNPMAAAYTWDFVTSSVQDITALTVSSTSPEAGDSGVAINSLVSVSFSEPAKPSTITAATFTLDCPAGASVAGTVAYAELGNVATWTPTSSLPAGTACTAMIADLVTDLAGNPLASHFEWTFFTGTTPDSTAPSVSSTSPSADAMGVTINSNITANFSEPMDAQTISTANFTLECPAGTPVGVTATYGLGGDVGIYTPAGDLPASTTCSATIAAGVEDAAHNPMGLAYGWSFTTGMAPDVTPPLVSSTSPPADASGIGFNSLVSVSFSESLNLATVTTASFMLDCPAGSSVAGTVEYAAIGNVATWTPTGSFPASTTCTATITTAIEDDAGNPLASAFNWSFTTGAVPDATAPTVASTYPFTDETGVATNTYIMADFSEPIDPQTVTPASFMLECPAGTPIASTVGYAVNSTIPLLIPTGDLPGSTLCTATITTAVTDAASNALASPYVWSFTTGLAPDNTAPQVDSTNPAHDAVGVCVNKSINVTFSEAMDPFSITTSSFTLEASPSGRVAGVVTYNDQTHIATFDPATDLTGTPATVYIATILGGFEGVLDLAGNMLPENIVTTFTTNASTCTTAPALGAASPFGGFGGNASLTNDGLETLITGDIGINAGSATITGLRDTAPTLYAVSDNNNGLVNGRIYTLTTPAGSIPGDAVTRASAAALAAFNSLSPVNLPGGIDMSDPAQCPSCGGAGAGAGELTGRTLPPGVYLSAATTFGLGRAGTPAGNLTLDGGGDENAVWVFQATTLTVGLTGPLPPVIPIQVLLINGAKPGNVFWYVPAGAVIGTGSTLAGTVLSNAAITISTTGGIPPTAPVTTINGRVISLVAGVTMTNAIINVPQP